MLLLSRMPLSLSLGAREREKEGEAVTFGIGGGSSLLRKEREAREEQQRERGAVSGCRTSTTRHALRRGDGIIEDHTGQVSGPRSPFLFLLFIAIKSQGEEIHAVIKMRAREALEDRTRGFGKRQIHAFRNRSRRRCLLSHFRAARASRGRPGAARGRRRRGGHRLRRGQQPGERQCGRRRRGWPFFFTVGVSVTTKGREGKSRREGEVNEAKMKSEKRKHFRKSSLSPSAS